MTNDLLHWRSIVDFEVDAATVLAVLAEKAQREPLLAAWLEAAQWQAVAITQNQTDEDEGDDDG